MCVPTVLCLAHALVVKSKKQHYQNQALIKHAQLDMKLVPECIIAPSITVPREFEIAQISHEFRFYIGGVLGINQPQSIGLPFVDCR